MNLRRLANRNIRPDGRIHYGMNTPAGSSGLLSGQTEGGTLCPNVYNIFNIRINNVSNGGAVNFGDNLFSNNAANQKAVGGNTIMGDASPSLNVDNNLVNDPDGEDQITNSVG